MPAALALPADLEVNLADLAGGTFRVVGTLHFDGETLRYAYAAQGPFSTPTEAQSVVLPLAALRHVALRPAWRGGALVLYPRHLEVTTRLPGASLHRIAFRIKRRDRPLAERLAGWLHRALDDESACVPFTLPERDFGLVEIRGVAYLHGASLVIEVGTSLFGDADRDYRIVQVELAALHALEHVPGRFSDRLVATPKKPDLLEAVPGKHDACVRLHVPRRHRDQAARLVAEALHHHPALAAF